MTTRAKKRLTRLGFGTLLLIVVIAVFLPAIGAGIILHPPHRKMNTAPPVTCEAVVMKGDGVDLHGWRGQAEGEARGTIIYLHGLADNRAGGAGVLERFQRRGFDVIAYDSRAHGASGGDACTYGYHEKQDLRRVLDTVRPGPIVLIGSSLGGAVALQLAADEPRVSAVVAAEAFSDLRTVAIERAPFFFNSGSIEQSFVKAEQEGGFRVDAVSPADAARGITVPVLVIHGADDTDTPPDHSRRIFEALAGPKRLILVPGAGHNESLQGGIWSEIETWVDGVIGPAGERRK